MSTNESALSAILEPTLPIDEAGGIPLHLANMEVPISLGRSQYETEFQCVPKAKVGRLIQSYFGQHLETDGKGFGAFIPGATEAGRKKNNITSVSMLPYDFDGGISEAALKRFCEESDSFLCLYTTYNHRTTSTKIKVRDKDVLTDEEAREHCASSPRYSHLKNVRVLHDGKRQKRQVRKGNKRVDASYFEVAHDPVEKFRVIFFLKEPIPLSEVGTDGFTEIYHAFGEHRFGGRIYDEAGSRPTQPSFIPTKPKGTTVKHFICYGFGEPSNWRSYWEDVQAKRAKKTKTQRSKQHLPVSSVRRRML